MGLLLLNGATTDGGRPPHGLLSWGFMWQLVLYSPPTTITMHRYLHEPVAY